MNLKEALEWASKNSTDEAVNRLKSRKAAKVLSSHILIYRRWIAEQGAQTNTCTFYILDGFCKDCQCKRKI
jgi:hypothetical protein